MARSSSNAVNLKVMDETSFDQCWTVIGRGGFGQVWKTKHLQWGFNVAVKILGPDDGLNSNEDLVKEADFMLRAAGGPYSMSVIGLFRGFIPKTVVTAVGLVMEMMERRSLASLQQKLDHPLPWPLVFRLAHQVALGMNCLHCLEPALIHKDLKPDNLLLDSDLNVKITDFGLSKFVNKATASLIKNFGTVPYVPPEALQGGATYAYDVYSYAMLLYSILHTGCSIPKFNNSRERPSLEYVKGMTASGLKELVDLMVKCWNQTPDQRPRFKECIAVTERLYEKHKNEICDAVYKVQQELDGVPVEENPSGTNQDTELKELRDKMMLGLQLQKDKMAEMTVELQLQKDKMAEMMVESKKAGAEHQLQKDKMAEMMVKMAALEDGVPMVENPSGANQDTELKELRDKMAEMMVKMAAFSEAIKELKKPDDELRRIQKYEVDVTLDPDTANLWLILSEDGKQVRCGNVWKDLPDNPERFVESPIVLGKQGFSAGKFYYEVQVGGKTWWGLGMVRESINRKESIIPSPNTGYWSIALRNGNKYYADADRDVLLPVKGKLQKVGVFVDYEKGLVSFYDVEARVHLYSFTGCSFTEKLFPFFCPYPNNGGMNYAPLIIHTPSMH